MRLLCFFGSGISRPSGMPIDEDLLLNRNCPLSWRYRDLVDAGQLKVIPKWLCCCKDATEILAALN